MNWNDPPEAEASTMENGKTRGFFPTLIDVFLNPGQAMTTLAAKPRWFLPLLLVTAMMAVPVFMHMDALVQITVEAQAAASPEVDDEALAVAESITGAFFLGSILVGVPLALVVFSVVYWLIFKIVGDEGGLKQWISMTAHASLISAVLGIIYAVVLGGPTEGAQDLPRLSLGFFLGGEGPLRTFLNGISVEGIWAAAVLACGARALSQGRRSFNVAFVITLAVMLVGAAVVPIIQVIGQAIGGAGAG